MNEFHKHLVEKFFPNASYNDLSIGEIEKFIEQIEYVCKAQRNACIREYDRYSDPNNIELTKEYIKTAEIERCDYE